MKARKGDLILVGVVHTATYVTRQGRGEDTLDYSYGVVASCTRAGVVKTYRQVGYGDALLSTAAVDVPASAVNERRVFTMPASEIDVMGVIGAAKAHCWPGHPGQPKGFDSLAEARALAQPFLTADFMAEAAA
jgi:hypothetical protein